MSDLSPGFSSVPSRVNGERQFFDVSILKLIVMSTVTFNLYQIYWFYRNWKLIKERGGDVWPVMRAIFGVLFAYSLFTEVREAGRSVSSGVATNAVGLAWAFFFFQMTWRLPDPAWLLGFASVWPLAIVQKNIASVHRTLGLDPAVNDNFSWKNIIGIVVGSILILLAIVGMLIPESAA